MSRRSRIQSFIEAATANQDTSFQLAQSQQAVAKELADLKLLTASGADGSDLHSAIKYLEAGAILLGRIIQRNIQKP